MLKAENTLKERKRLEIGFHLITPSKNVANFLREFSAISSGSKPKLKILSSPRELRERERERERER